MVRMESIGKLNDNLFVRDLSQSLDGILNYIDQYLNEFKFQLTQIANTHNIDIKENFANRQQSFGILTFLCQYFFQELRHKIQWPMQPNHYKDRNNNYTDENTFYNQ
jgi:hypothetical protein